MIPKLKREKEFQEGFERIFKTPEYVFDLSVGEAKEYLELVNSFFELSYSKFRASLEADIRGDEFIEFDIFEFLRDKYNLGNMSNIDIRNSKERVTELLKAKIIFREPGVPPGKPTIKQVALMQRYIYLTSKKFEPNWPLIAKQFGFNSPTSGNKLYIEFNKLKSKPDRINYRSASRNLEKAIEMLTDYPEAKAYAEDELKGIASKK